MNPGIRPRRRPARVAGPLRPETEWESIEVPGGDPFVVRVVPVAELVADPGGIAIVVLHTHDYELAARVAWPLWREEHDGPLSRPVRRWWWRIPTSEVRHDAHGAAGASADHMWWPARPGAPGAIPLVEFPARHGTGGAR